MLCLCLAQNLSSDIFERQITTLTVSLNENEKNEEIFESRGRILTSIFVVFKRLTTLIIDRSLYQKLVRLCLTDEPLLTHFRSSTRRQLTVNVQCFDDCLCLLDGRFPSLHTLDVELSNMYCSNEIPNEVSSTKA